MLQTLKQKIAQFLDTIAKANQESLGNRPLRCCNPENRDKHSEQKP